MGFQADTRYNGVVGNGSCLMESQRGTVGYQVMLSCDDGDTIYIIWLTEKNRKRALRDFQSLGVDPEKLGFCRRPLKTTGARTRTPARDRLASVAWRPGFHVTQRSMSRP